jgi:hypothetical protein
MSISTNDIGALIARRNTDRRVAGIPVAPLSTLVDNAAPST